MDEQFQQLQMLQEDGGTPGFVAEVVTLFCDDAERIISELAALLYALFTPDYQYSYCCCWQFLPPVLCKQDQLTALALLWDLHCLQGAAHRGLR